MDRKPSVEEQLHRWEAERGLEGAEHGAVYVSTPITSGARFAEWYRDEGRALGVGTPAYQGAHRASVMLPNLQDAARFIEILRWKHVGLVIDPNTLDVPGWGQDDYHRFWTSVIERQAKRLIFLAGWESSRGCAIEYEIAQRLDIDCVDHRLSPLPIGVATARMRAGLASAEACGVDVAPHRQILARLEERHARVESETRLLYKDAVLDRHAELTNVAQFVSFAPDLEQRFSRVLGYERNRVFGGLESALDALLATSPEGKVNIRSFRPERPEGNPFEKGLTRTEDVAARVRRFADEGLHTIVNESIDESDGGVSGVSYRGVIEFAPDATPRVVDDPHRATALLPFELAMGLLERVYGVEPDLRGREGARVEFSLHPGPRGWRRSHTVIWQAEQRPQEDLVVRPWWPNPLSKMIGDKTFGLAMADAAGFRVPRTLAFTPRLAPFSFGRPTGSGDRWTRTAPAVKWPGYYPSVRGWVDPLAALADPWATMTPDEAPPPIEPGSGDGGGGEAPPLGGILVQEAVVAAYSGRCTITRDGIRVDGVRGEGDRFMLGLDQPDELPAPVGDAVEHASATVLDVFGAASIEWVFDGAQLWIVQLNPSPSTRAESVREGLEWVDFDYAEGGLEGFRAIVLSVVGTKRGIRVQGRVSPLSHAGEIADLHGVPARFEGV